MASLKLIDIDALEEFRLRLFEDVSQFSVTEKIKWYLKSYQALNLNLTIVDISLGQGFVRTRRDMRGCLS